MRIHRNHLCRDSAKAHWQGHPHTFGLRSFVPKHFRNRMYPVPSDSHLRVRSCLPYTAHELGLETGEAVNQLTSAGGHHDPGALSFL